MVGLPSPALTAVEVVRLLQAHRFDLSTEKHLQVDVEQVLTAASVTFEREKRLSPRDIPDFVLAGGIVIECKMRGKSTKIQIYEQLERYTKHDDVTSIILASNVSMGLPEEINGKPVYAASLSRGWI